MTIRVLVVDDSRFFRKRVQEMLESDTRIKVVGIAENGLEAVQKSSRLKPDVITMDIEMPVMDGITATKRILATQNIPILMFSSLTTEGAQTTFDALEAGAIDYLPKKFEDISRDKIIARRTLCERVITVAKQKIRGSRTKTYTLASKPGNVTRNPNAGSVSVKSANKIPSRNSTARRKGQYKIVVFGTSTGGPVALQQVLCGLPADFSVPIMIVQHMPGSFTTAFAQRLDKLCKICVKEAADGDSLVAGTALLAPGGKQMGLEKKGAKLVVRITDSDSNQNYKPSVDLTLESIAKFEPRNTLAIILTGMGADGCKGAEILKKSGSTIWAQDEASCVVYGMPAAVAEAGAADSILSLDDIQHNLINRV